MTLGTTAVVGVLHAVAQGESPAEQTESIRFRVLQASNDQPLADAQVEFRYWGDETKNRKETILSDEDGIAVFEYPSGDQKAYLRVMTRRPGYVPYHVSIDMQPMKIQSRASFSRCLKSCCIIR